MLKFLIIVLLLNICLFIVYSIIKNRHELMEWFKNIDVQTIEDGWLTVTILSIIPLIFLIMFSLLPPPGVY